MADQVFVTPEDLPAQRTCRRLGPRDVLDMHADLQRMLGKPDPWVIACFKDYAVRDVRGTPQYAASHVHPSVSLADLDPWMSSLGSDLAGASTYQVTAEMIDLAANLSEANSELGEIRAEDLPSDWGFMWLDKPVPRPSIEDDEDHPVLMMHAVSWAFVPSMQARVGGTDAVLTVPGVRLREWGYNDDLDIRPRPLHLMGQATVPVGHGIHTNLTEHWLIHMLWILMGMEITSVSSELPGRHGAKRAANLKHKMVHVVTLRRPAREQSRPGATPRNIDWSCSWIVRGHHRKAPHGGTFADGRESTWVRPYIKGPDGLPLRSSDILHRLAR